MYVRKNLGHGLRVAATLALASSMGVGALVSSASAAKSVKKHATTLKVETPKAASITEAGSSLLYPLWNLWAPSYQSKYHQVKLTTGAGGSGLGISEASAGTINIGSSDAYLAPSQVAATPSLMNIPLAISSQVIAYNVPGITTHLKLSGSIIAGIYEGQITNWDDPAIAKINPSVTLPHLTIVPLFRSDGSGDTFIFTGYLSKQNPNGWGKLVGQGTSVTWPKNSALMGENGNGGMVSACAQTKGCIAYVGSSYLSSVLGDGMTYAALQNGKGQFVLWSTKAVAKEATNYKVFRNHGAVSMIDAKVKGGYPIINYEYAIVNKHQSSSNVASATRSLLEWAITPRGGNAPSFLSQVGFLPLPPSFVAGSFKLIKSIK